MSKSKGLSAIKYAKTPFVFVTHKTNNLSNITLQEVVDIYNGNTISWPDDTPVRLILRPAGEASTKILESMSEDMNRAVQNSFKRSGLNIAVTDQENADLIERLPGSFGASTLCQLISEKRNLNILSLNGVKPSVRTLADGAYPYFKESLYNYRSQVFTPGQAVYRFCLFFLRTVYSQQNRSPGYQVIT